MIMELTRGEFVMPNQVDFVTNLPFGQGMIGTETKFDSPEERQQFAADLRRCTVPLTKPNTADCVDERETLSLADGTCDPEILANRVVHQRPGGLVLAVTKAAVGADLAVIRGAKGFQEAYITLGDLLASLGFEDGGHKSCGASKLVEQSVADQLEVDQILGAIPVLTEVNGDTPRLISMNQETKKQRLESGFYGLWSPGWHEGYLADTVPQNFSILAEDSNDHVTHGHHSSGIYAMHSSGYGFEKNSFIKLTGREAFATSSATADELSERLIKCIGGSQMERQRLQLEFALDAAHVLNLLVAEKHPVFAESA